MLFRKQAMDAKKQKLHGDISLAQPLSIYTSALILLVVIAIDTLLSFSHYARKETVRGYLVPNKWLIKTYANRNGYIDVLHAQEGDKVIKGMPLVTMVLIHSMLSAEDLSESLIEELNKQLSFFNNEQNVNQSMKYKKAKRLKTAILDYQASLSFPFNLSVLFSEKLALQFKQQKQHEKLYQDGYLSTLYYQVQ